jgi:N6-adenosine-specific RNA methylase IME4
MNERLPEGHVFAGLLRNGYRCIMADPATKFVGGTKGRPQHYKRMTDHEIAALPVFDLVHPDGCFLGLWVTSPKIYRPKNSKKLLRPDEIADIWRFRYSSRMFVWIKTNRRTGILSSKPMFIHPSDGIHFGNGYTSRKNAEDCLLFRVGRPTRVAKDVREPIFAPAREHSRKPDEAFERFERFCAGPYLELFSREPREGWDGWGDEPTKFAVAA